MPLTSNPDCSFKAPTPLLGVLKLPSQQALVLGPSGRGGLPWGPACHAADRPSPPAPADAELPGAHVPRPGPGQGLQHQPHHTQEVAGECGPLLAPEYCFIEFPGNGPWGPSFGPGLPTDKGHTPVRILRGPIPHQTLSAPKLLSVSEKIVGTRESQVKSMF